MGGLQLLLCVLCAFVISGVNGRKRVSDMMPFGSRSDSVKHPHLKGWSPDSNYWNTGLYPGFKANDLRRGRGRTIVPHLTSDSPALIGSSITFTTTLEFPKCQKEDSNGDLVYDKHCSDADGVARPGQYVYNWTSWLDDYGFGNCTDLSTCNVFPDGKPFPQSHDWRRRNFVYVWHTMGQYYQTCGGSVSSITLNTTNMTLGAEMMEVLVYHKRERRKYTPAATANDIYFVTDQIPFAVNISQKHDRNSSDNVFIKGSDIIFKVQLHDPSHYLQKSATVNYIWDFDDGNRLITHSTVATHAYNLLGNVTVKLTVKAAFPVPCPPPTPSPTSHTTATPRPTTAVATTSPHTTTVAQTTTTEIPTTTNATVEPPTTTNTTELPSTTATVEATTALNSTASMGNATLTSTLLQRDGADCLRFMYGNFEEDLIIVDGVIAVQSIQANKIVEVSTTQVTNITVDFLVKCTGSLPSSACTIISDATCKEVMNITCENIPPSKDCQLTIQRTFSQPGTYCVNVTLIDSQSLALASTHVTVGKESRHIPATETVLIAGAVLVALVVAVSFIVYRRYKEYKPLSRPLCGGSSEGMIVYFSQLKTVLFPGSEERSPLLQDKPAP